MDLSFNERRKFSLENPEDFWSEVASRLHWDKKWDTTMDTVSDYPFTKWFVGGELNMCYNCIDRHIDNGFGDKIGFIYDSPLTNTRKEFTYTNMKEQVSKLAGLLVSLGVQKGDVVAVYMPPIPEGPFSFLACARIGAIHNSIAGGLPAEDLAIRIQHSQAKLILTASHGFHSNKWADYKSELDKALQLCSHKVEKCILLQREEMNRVNFDSNLDIDWKEAIDNASPHDCVPVSANDPLFILYTSGSTGTPKAIVHSVGSFAVRIFHEYNYIVPNLEIGPLCATTSLGWIAGHMLVVYGPLLNKHISFLFEGDHLLIANPRGLYRLLSYNKIPYTFIRPGILRTLKGMDPDCSIAKEFDFKVEMVIVGGEFIDETTLSWTFKAFGAPIYNIWAQTELAAFLSGIPDKSLLGENNFTLAGISTVGIQIVCLNEDLKVAEPGEIGRLLVKLPLPPGAFSTLYKNKKLSKEIYFDSYPGYFDTKDDGFISENGQIKIERRADDVIKAGAIYVSGTSIENIISEIAGVLDVSVVSKPHSVHRELPIAFIVISIDKRGYESELSKEIIDQVCDHFGRSMPFENVVIVNELPRSRTGKINKPSLMALLRNTEQSTGGLENPQSLKDIQDVLKRVNLI